MKCDRCNSKKEPLIKMIVVFPSVKLAKTYNLCLDCADGLTDYAEGRKLE